MGNVAINLDRISQQIRGDYSILILFGSFSRGDNNKNSDIDILQVTNDYFPSYSTDYCNVSVYTISQLTNMAKEGSLFVLHLIREAQIIKGDKNFIDVLSQNFHSPVNYEEYRKELIITANILDVDMSTYLMSWKGFNNLICYLFRSFLYSRLFDEHELIFSIKLVADYFDDSYIEDFFFLKRDKKPNYNLYRKNIKVFEEYAGTVFTNKYKDPRILLDNMNNESKLMTALSLHFIKDTVNDPTY